MTFTRFQGKLLIHIVSDIERVYKHRIVSHERVLPALTIIDKVFTQRFHFARRTIGGNGFQDEVIVCLIVEPAEKRLLSKKLPDRIAVVVDDCVFARGLTLEYKQPVILKDCYSQSKIKRLSVTTRTTPHSTNLHPHLR